MMNKQKVRSAALDGLIFLLGSAVYAVSVNAFSAPNHIAPGGATGLATLLNYVSHLPIGAGILLVNLPLFLLGVWKLGWRFMTKTVIATVVLSAAIDLSAPWLPVYEGDTLLAALFAGVLSGLGLGVIFIRGATTGGSDLAARLFALKFPYIPMGRMILIIDAVIIAAAALVYRNVETALYAGVMLFVSSKVIDSVLYGMDTGRFMMIVSSQPELLAKHINEDIHRGVTLLHATGAYTGDSRRMLVCAVRRHEVFRVRSLVKQVDPAAFMMIGEASEILGEGFKPLEEEE
ncbi:MAG: YitT family protein [Clostridiales bacterium]|nr:YitT family protein [Clostridiales bacterium]